MLHLWSCNGNFCHRLWISIMREAILLVCVVIVWCWKVSSAMARVPVHQCVISEVTLILLMGLDACTSGPVAMASTDRSLVSVWVGLGLSSDILSSGPMGLSAQAGKGVCVTAVETFLPISWAFDPQVGITTSGTLYLHIEGILVY